MIRLIYLTLLSCTIVPLSGMNFYDQLLQDKFQCDLQILNTDYAKTMLAFAAQAQIDAAAYTLSFLALAAKENLTTIQQNASFKKINIITCCNKHFISQNGYRRHLKGHKLVRPFKCTYRGCTYAARNKFHLEEHARIHTKEKPCQCYECRESFKNSSALHYHIITNHRPELLRHCKICNFKTPFKSALIRHMFGHSGIKPFTCKTCGENLISASSLKRHEKIHTNDRPYQCNLCNYRAIQPQHLENHIQKNH